MSSRQDLGITESKEHDPGEWYAEVVRKAGLADYAPMGGFIVTRPRGYEIWERMKEYLDGWFKDSGVRNAYFPMFIPESYLEREKEIVEGFDPEVAWVTHGGYDELDERLAVRPTSESIITPYLSQWIRSHRDLPMRVNQWCSVVRWEATDTKPFFRTKEFLWQEGHTAHRDRESAWEETMLRVEPYRRLHEDVLCLPVLEGRKPDHDKFPGADTTATIQPLMPDGRALQAATSHYLGTSFGEAFDLTYVDEGEDEYVAHTTSWGLSWRSLGGLVMTHSDDQGLVTPPKVAPEQVVVVPIWQEASREAVLEYASAVADELDEAGMRAHLDERDERNPGFKFNEWELKGVPLRIEIGPNEVSENELTLVHRPDGESTTEGRANAVETVREHLEEVEAKLYVAAEANLRENVRDAESRNEILGTIGQHGGYVRAPWCGDEACETEIKEEIAAEIVMVPFPDDEDAHPREVFAGEADCAICGENAEETAYFAKSY
jgi:prolyl-tRNA synthetase